MRSHYALVESFITKDGSEIRELMHPEQQGNRNQSLAEAIVPIGSITELHKHLLSEEIYHITQGQAEMTLGAEKFDVGVGDSICIMPGTPHCIRNTGSEKLRILCGCSPAYSHEDTVLL